jgi:hypothetical protein
MSLEILSRAARYHRGNPVHRVRCPMCGEVYVTTGMPGKIRSRRGCRSCTARKRFTPKGSP